MRPRASPVECVRAHRLAALGTEEQLEPLGHVVKLDRREVLDLELPVDLVKLGALFGGIGALLSGRRLSG